MSSVPLSVFPLPAVLPGATVPSRRKYAPAPPVTALEILSAALLAEDRATAMEPAAASSRCAEMPAFGDRAPRAGAEARPLVLSGRTTFSPAAAIVHAHRQRRAGLEETTLALYHGSLSVCQAEETARALWGEDVNGAVISTCAGEVTPRLDAWLKRPITRRYDFVFLDAIAVRQRLRNGPQETDLHYAVGVDALGVREVLGVQGGATEDEAAWPAFLRDLRRRGLKEVRLFVGGMDEALVRAVAGEFPAVRLQVCVAQLERAVLARVPGPELHAASLACAALHPEPEAGVSAEKIRQMVERLNRNDLVEASALLGRMLPYALSYRPFPRHHWSQISTTDAIRRAVKPLRERIRHLGPIEDTRALVLLAAAHLRHVSRTVWGRRRYLKTKAGGRASN
jgi:transposase-like protein